MPLLAYTHRCRQLLQSLLSKVYFLMWESSLLIWSQWWELPVLPYKRYMHATTQSSCKASSLQPRHLHLHTYSPSVWLGQEDTIMQFQWCAATSLANWLRLQAFLPVNRHLSSSRLLRAICLNHNPLHDFDSETSTHSLLLPHNPTYYLSPTLSWFCPNVRAARDLAQEAQHLELIVSLPKGREGSHCLVILACLEHTPLGPAQWWVLLQLTNPWKASGISKLPSAHSRSTTDLFFSEPGSCRIRCSLQF